MLGLHKYIYEYVSAIKNTQIAIFLPQRQNSKYGKTTGSKTICPNKAKFNVDGPVQDCGNSSVLARVIIVFH